MQRFKVLLADDHALVRAGIRDALIALPDIEIVGEVGDGDALMTALGWHKPDLLLLDVTMPNFEPISAIRDILTHQTGMKILVVSAFDDDVYVQGLMGAGAHGYHLKDQPLSDLRLAVQRVLAGEKWVSSRLFNKLLGGGGGRGEMPALTPRQRDILQWLMQGLDNQNIARNMGLSVKTIENHLTRLYRQLNVQSRLEAANYGQNHPELIQQPSKLIKRSDSIATIRPATNHQPPATILLVDDNTRFRGQLRRMIGKMHPQANIYEAGNIAHAVSLTQKITPKIVFVDVVLADEDGIACTRQIKQHSPTSRVILISAYPDREFHRRGVQAGATAFVDKKDLDVAALRQIINDILH